MGRWCILQGLVVDGQMTVSLFALMDLIPAWTDRDSGYLLSGIFLIVAVVGRLQKARRQSQGLAELELPFSVVVPNEASYFLARARPDDISNYCDSALRVG